MSELGAPLTGVRDELRLFTFGSSTAPAKTVSGSWRLISLQADPVDSEGHLEFGAATDLPRQPIRGTDLLTLRPEEFAPLPSGWTLRRPGAGGLPPLPCSGPVVHGLKSPWGVAFLTSCPGQGQAPAAILRRSPGGSTVLFDAPRHRLTSGSYEYRFQPENYLQFESISFTVPSGGVVPIARDSRLYIRADVRRFLTMEFDSRHIESRLEATRHGGLGELARLSFFLKILMFHIKMSLSTDVGFYADAGHIPMMVTLPGDASHYLHPASGILYSWNLVGDVGRVTPDLRLPRLDAAVVRRGWQELGKIGLGLCPAGSGPCRFRYGLKVMGKDLAMQFAISRELVARGFFPLYVDDVAKDADAMGWDEALDSVTGKRRGLYFEISGLEAGGHPWDFWLTLGAPAAEGGVCPVPLTIVPHLERG